jgi:hypothetical protein
MGKTCYRPWSGRLITETTQPKLWLELQHPDHVMRNNHYPYKINWLSRITFGLARMRVTKFPYRKDRLMIHDVKSERGGLHSFLGGTYNTIGGGSSQCGFWNVCVCYAEQSGTANGAWGGGWSILILDWSISSFLQHLWVTMTTLGCLWFWERGQRQRQRSKGLKRIPPFLYCESLKLIKSL